jgi:transcriptional regulator with XRE-family HTH domain
MPGIVEKIRERAAVKGLTIRRIELAAGLSNGAIARWNEKSPSIDKVFRVARVLGCTVDELIAEPTGGEQYFRSVKGDGIAAC